MSIALTILADHLTHAQEAAAHDDCAMLRRIFLAADRRTDDALRSVRIRACTIRRAAQLLALAVHDRKHGAIMAAQCHERDAEHMLELLGV